MASCSICNDKVGFSPSKISMGGKNCPVCTNCFLEYMNLTSNNVNLKLNAIEYFKSHADERAELGKDALRMVNDFEDNMQPEIERIKKENEEKEFIKEHRIELMNNICLTNGFNIEHHDITCYIGLVSGEVVLGTGFLSEWGAELADFAGGKASSFSAKMSDAKEAAIDIMKEKAVEIGANAIIGVSFSFIMFNSNMIGVSVNGTAVKIN